MAPLPMSRQKMSPTFNEIAIDLFGPLEIRDTVKKRAKKKVWGIIISCLSTRAMHIDLSEDYSTDRVIQTLQRFIAIRGCPSSIFVDKGSQLHAQEFKTWALDNGIKAEFAPAEGQHQNGVSESLIKSIKRSLLHVIGDQVLTFSGLQVVLYRVTSIINARPIGIVSGSDPSQPTAITPNHLILGRSTPDVFTEKFDTSTNCNKRYAFLQNLVNQWWKQWYDTVLPSLVPSCKWRQKHRCVKPGDVCIIRYANEVKANYRHGRVIDVKKSSDGLVRTVKLVYKNSNDKSYRKVDIPVHGIAVIVPVEEQTQLNPVANEFNLSNKP